MYAFRRGGSKVEDDVEAGTLYPGLSYGDSELRWGFVRKVYGILTTQLLLTTLVSAVVVLYSPINQALKDSPGLLLGFSFLPLILMFPLYIYQQKHPLNFIFLGLFTTFLSLSVGVACANTQGEIVLEALILTSTVVFSLTGYTFWAVKKGKDFSYLGPILFSGLVLLIVTGLIQTRFSYLRWVACAQDEFHREPEFFLQAGLVAPESQPLFNAVLYDSPKQNSQVVVSPWNI